MDGTVYPVSPAAVALPILAFITLIIDVPPLVWHIANRNLSASSLVFWTVMGNLMNFVNALIWPKDDMQNWWHGQVLCDIEVKIMVAGYIGTVASLMCVMRNLAKALDVRSSNLRRAGARQRRQTVIDCLLCFGTPTYMAMIHYVVQPSRYYIFAISGCTTSFDSSWPKLVLVFIWPLVFCLIAVYYSGEFLIFANSLYFADFTQCWSFCACVATAGTSPRSWFHQTRVLPRNASCDYFSCRWP